MNGRLGDVVLITGGCGFLGKHLTKMLPEKAGNISEIRVLDLQSQPEDFYDCKKQFYTACDCKILISILELISSSKIFFGQTF